MDTSRRDQHAPGPSPWPLGFALGVVVLLVGVVVSFWIVVLGAVVAVAAGLGWLRDVRREGGRARATAAAEDEPEPEPAPAPVRYTRSKFLEVSTLGLGGVIGGIVTVPALGFAIGPAFLDQGVDEQEIGPLEDFPEGEYVVATYMTDPDVGEVTRQTAFVRYNGLLEGQPSFTIVSNHCVHLGCPVQPNAVMHEDQAKTYGNVTLIPAPQPSGFGCPCHGGQYDNEGNVTAGPPVRALDRFSFSVRNGKLYLGRPFSVARVEGTGADAKIFRHTFANPGVHVDGVESWLYPVQPPR